MPIVDGSVWLLDLVGHEVKRKGAVPGKGLEARLVIARSPDATVCGFSRMGFHVPGSC